MDLAVGQKVSVTRIAGAPFKAVVEDPGPRTTIVRSEAGKRMPVANTRIRAERSASRLPPVPEREPMISEETAHRILVALGQAGPTRQRITKPVPKNPPTRSKPYKEYVSAHACCGCGEPGPNDPHHFAMAGDGDKGTSLKPDDHRCVPLCRGCHDFWHDNHHLPGMTVEATNLFFLRTQVTLLVAWYERAGK